MNIYSPLQPCPYCDDRVLPHVMAKHILRRHPEKLRPPDDSVTEKSDAREVRPGARSRGTTDEEATATPDDRRPTAAAGNIEPEAYSSIAQAATATADADRSKKRKPATPVTRQLKSKIQKGRKNRRRHRPRKSSKIGSHDSAVSRSAKHCVPPDMIECRSCGAIIRNTREARARHVREEHNQSCPPKPGSEVPKSTASAKTLGVKRKRFWVRILPGGLPSLGKKR
jgi:hypothetical protein